MTPITVPKGTAPATCKRCDATIYFVATAAGRQQPVHCDVEGGRRPTETEDGAGISHFADCPAAYHFRRPKK